MWYEFIGILATVFVLISFLFNDEVLIRAINLVGALIFVIYAVLIQSLSVGLLNFILVFIQLYKLFKLKNKKS